MKTLGFSSGQVTTMVLAEALLITLLGAAIGLVVAGLAAAGIGKGLQQFFPLLGMPAQTYVIGAVVAIALGALAAVLPCMQAWQLKIVDALRNA
jgi:putative ABC transport system permease protein